MPLCCVDASVAARIVAVLGAAVATVAVTQLSSELVDGRGTGNGAEWLGLNLDELDSRQRHVAHAGHHGQPRMFGDNEEPFTFDPYVRDVMAGFLAFSVLYLASCGLLAYSSLKPTRWGALPWLWLQALSVASHVARLVVLVAQFEHLHSQPDHHALYNHPMQPHPAHAAHGPEDETLEAQLERAWEQHVLEHGLEHEVQREHSAAVTIAVTVVYLLANVYGWLVVLVAHRRWRESKKPRRQHSGPGDEDWSLSMPMTSLHHDGPAPGEALATKNPDNMLAPDEV